jgi:hypothetical protein
VKLSQVSQSLSLSGVGRVPKCQVSSLTPRKMTTSYKRRGIEFKGNSQRQCPQALPAQPSQGPARSWAQSRGPPPRASPPCQRARTCPRQADTPGRSRPPPRTRPSPAWRLMALGGRERRRETVVARARRSETRGEWRAESGRRWGREGGRES